MSWCHYTVKPKGPFKHDAIMVPLCSETHYFQLPVLCNNGKQLVAVDCLRQWRPQSRYFFFNFSQGFGYNSVLTFLITNVANVIHRLVIVVTKKGSWVSDMGHSILQCLKWKMISTSTLFTHIGRVAQGSSAGTVGQAVGSTRISPSASDGQSKYFAMCVCPWIPSLL